MKKILAILVVLAMVLTSMTTVLAGAPSGGGNLSAPGGGGNVSAPHPGTGTDNDDDVVTNWDLINQTLEWYEENRTDLSDLHGDPSVMWELVALATIGYAFDDGNFDLPELGDLPNASVFDDDVTYLSVWAREIIAMAALGYDSWNFDGRNFAEELGEFINDTDNIAEIEDALVDSDVDFTFSDILLILYSQRASTWDAWNFNDHFVPIILDLQEGNGGFNITGWGEDVDSTAMVFLAFQMGFSPSICLEAAFTKIVQYLRDAQLECGGFPWNPNQPEEFGPIEANANSTGVVMLALAAAGFDILEDWQVDDDVYATPVHSLMSFMMDDGSFGADWGTGMASNALATRDGFLGLVSIGLGTSVFSNLGVDNPRTPPTVEIPIYDDENGNGNGGNGGGTTPPIRTASIIVIDHQNRRLADRSFSIAANETAYSLLRRAGLALQTTGSDDTLFVTSIAGLWNGAQGPQSGWKFAIQARNTTQWTVPNVSSAAVELRDGDLLVWYFALQPNQLPNLGGSGTWPGGGGGGSGSGGNQGGGNVFTPPPTTPGPGTPSVTEPDGNFVDVNENDWFYWYVAYAFDNGLLNGVSATEFAPNAASTRAMFVTVLWRMTGSPSAGASDFVDVASGTWYSTAVAWAAANDIVSGVGDGLFAPTAEMTREQMATLLYRYQQFSGQIPPDLVMGREFADWDYISDWAKSSVNVLTIQDILRGDEAGNFNPRRAVTRAEIAAVLYRFLNS
ncbi:MAG: S-layer homology domain-containing protein [Oscillospiraceae bacterium]|nr:S-layer homology domain-containing protein [Oscillospiraceae bacterium]